MPSLKRWSSALTWGLAGLAALFLLVWWGLPVLLASQLPPRLSQALGRPVTIAEREPAVALGGSVADPA